MQVKLADTAGFCFGVKRAIDILYELPSDTKKCCTLGPIIHNKVMVEELEKRNIYAINSIEDSNDYDVVVIRSHGVPKSVKDKLCEMGKEVIDATCPFVSKIHKIVNEKSSENKIILIAGDKHHPEVEGIIGHCVNKAYTFKNEDELRHIINIIPDGNNNQYCLVSQTTFDTLEWYKFVKILKKVYTNLEIFDTICNATSMRQSQTNELSKTCDAMIVIGDKSSSNTAKLYNIAVKNCKRTFLVETANDLDVNLLNECKVVGVTAGASTPDMIIKEVLEKL